MNQIIRVFNRSNILYKKIPFILADIGEGITKVEILKWHIKPNQQIKQFEKIVEVQSDKATVDITSRYDGKITNILYGEGDSADVGSALVEIEIDEDGEGKEEDDNNNVRSDSSVPKKEKAAAETKSNQKEHRDSENKQTQSTQISNKPTENNKIKAMPSVRQQAKQLGIDLETVKATGNQGQVTMQDLLKKSKPNEKAPQNYKISPLTPHQRAMTKSMLESIKIPQFGYHDEYNIKTLFSVKNALKETFSAKMTVMPFYIKALSLALLDFPHLNGHFIVDSDRGDHVRIWSQHNISIAIDTRNHGLVTPILHNVNSMSILEISKALEILSQQANANRLPPSSFLNGTIAISNIGAIGGCSANPLLIPPQLVIMAIGRAKESLCMCAGDGGVLLPVSWSADHRVVDGASIAKFSARLGEIMRVPGELLMHLNCP